MSVLVIVVSDVVVVVTVGGVAVAVVGAAAGPRPLKQSERAFFWRAASRMA